MAKRMTPARLWRAASYGSRNRAAPRVIQEMTDLIQDAERLRDAIWARDKQAGAGAMASVVLQFMTTFGHDDDFVRKALPSLERLTQLVLGGDFDQAEAHVLGWLARFRQMTTGLANVLR